MHSKHRRSLPSSIDTAAKKLALLWVIQSALVVLPLVAQAPDVRFDYEYPYSDAVPITRYAERRETITKSLGPKSVLVSFAADVRNRQNDVDYEYRQNSNFWYLTGMPDPEAVLMLSGSPILVDGSMHNEILFVRDRAVKREVWTGTRMGSKEAMEILKIRKAVSIDSLEAVIARIARITDTFYHTGLPTSSYKTPLTRNSVSITKVMEGDLRKLNPDLWISSYGALNGMREVKDSDELRQLQRAVDITIEGFVATMKRVKPGMKEYQIEAIMEHTFKYLGAQDLGYPSIVGSDFNACILHYTSNRKRTMDRSIVLADCGAEYNNYTADITRTFPVSGSFTPEQRLIYNAVLQAQDSGIAACVKGNAFRAPHLAAQAVIRERLLSLGIIEKPEQASWYFMHGTSHYLGLDVHDPGTNGPLKANSVITVEPGIYIPPGSPCDKKWWGIGVRIEDDIHITDQGPRNMSAALPRSADEIEQLVRSGHKRDEKGESTD